MTRSRSLVESREHFRACHERWVKLLNRDQDDPAYQDEWYSEQCLACRYYIPLSGAFGEDWGVCSNEESEFDRHVMFEHDGCSGFSRAEEWWSLRSEGTGGNQAGD